LRRGALLGALVGVLVGSVTAVIVYAKVSAMRDEIWREVYRQVLTSGAGPDMAKSIADYVASSVVLWASLGTAIIYVAIFAVVGVVMAATWGRLRIGWVGRGLLFGAVLAIIINGPYVTGSPLYLAASILVIMAGALLLASLLNRWRW